MVGRSLLLLLLLMTVTLSSTKDLLQCNGQVEEMTVPTGSAAVLLCSFNWTGRLPEVRQVAWHKSTEGAPSLVVHTRDLFQENKNQDREFAGRTFLAASWFEKRDASLNLSNISINDTGLYQCQISTERPKASGVCADIKLTVTPGAAVASSVPSVLLLTGLALASLLS